MVVIVVRLESSGVVVMASGRCAQVGRVVLSLEPGGLDGVDVTKLLVTCRAGCGATVPGA